MKGDMSVPESLRFTYEDYARLPDDRRYEVIDAVSKSRSRVCSERLAATVQGLLKTLAGSPFTS
jgi:hypothetical protein